MIAWLATTNALDDLALLLPEAVLTAGLLLVLLADAALPPKARHRLPLLGFAACLAAAFAAMGAHAGALGDLFAVDRLTQLARPAILLATGCVLLGGQDERDHREDRGAWTASVLGVGLGTLLAAAATSFLSLWLGLETLSLASYVLAAWRRGDRRAAEAGTKFVLFGGTASAVMLFGMSHVYGLTGHLDFGGIGQAMAGGLPTGALAALCLCGAGLAYKLTLVPMHFYAPDVYQGAPAWSVAATGVVPKLGAFLALARVLALAVPQTPAMRPELSWVLAAAASLSMLVAAFVAVVQRDAKRIVAFSGIGHAGAMLLALACLPGTGAIAAVAFYLGAYALANVGALACLAVLERDRGSCALPALAGAGAQRPWLAAALCLFLFSLAGVPPLAGFLAKWGVLQQALAAGDHGGFGHLTVAALLLLLATAVSAWSYLLVVRAVLLAKPAADTPNGPASRLPIGTALVVVGCAAGSLAFGLWLDGLPAIAQFLEAR